MVFRHCLLALVVAAACCCATARPLSPVGGTKPMAVPCVMKYYNSFCYLETSKETCTFYSSPSYATYKECATSTNMGKTLKCSEASAEEKKTERYAKCLDAEPASAAVKPASAKKWSVKDNSDIKGKDVACDGKSFCQVCKPVAEVQDRCGKTKGCVAFTYDGKCGFLKTAGSGGIVARQGWKAHISA